jgi:hypothetical protein
VAGRSNKAAFALWVAIVGLVALHLWPPHGGPEPLLLGVLPWDLTWHVLWMVGAMAAVMMMTSTRLWPDGDEGDDG